MEATLGEEEAGIHQSFLRLPNYSNNSYLWGGSTGIDPLTDPTTLRLVAKVGASWTKTKKARKNVGSVTCSQQAVLLPSLSG